MAKTLRVRTRTGWVTKPVADEPGNRLLAEEVDDNFLALEDAIAAKAAFEVGYAALVAKPLAMPGWLAMDGSVYNVADYPLMEGKLSGPYAFNSIISEAPASGLTYTRANPAYSPDGRYLAIGDSVNGGMRVLDTETWTYVSGTPSLSVDVYSFSYSPDGSLLAVGLDNLSGIYVAVYDTSTWTNVSGISGFGTSGIGRGVSFSPDGSLLAVAHDNSAYGYFTVFRVSDWGVEQNPSVAGVGMDCVFSSDGSKAAVVYNSTPYLTLYDTADWSVVTGTPTLAGIGRGVSFSNDGKYLAAVHSNSPYLTVVDLSNTTVVSGTPDLGFTGSGVVFSPDSAYLSAVFFGGDYRIVADVSDWSTLTGVPAIAGLGRGCKFSPDGSQLAVVHDTSPGLTIIAAKDPTKFIVPDSPAATNGMEWRIKAEDV